MRWVSTVFLLVAAAGCAPPVELARTRADVGAEPAPDAEPQPIDGGETPSRRPCLRDQGGAANRGCDPGQVCHLPSGECRPGRPCETDADCDPCSSLADPADCRHGFPLTAWCDARHGRVCVRSRTLCEPCEDNCGRMHPNLLGRPLDCLMYPDGQRYCGRPCAGDCPRGFVCRDDGQCFREDGCVRNFVICPAADDPDCVGTDQICAGEACPNAGDARCVTNDIPGSLGICLGTCADSSECPPSAPLCNPRNGICTLPCEKGNCSPDQTCHRDGLCWPACRDDAECEAREPGTYCNLPGRAAPRAFKPYRDVNSCAPLGCERSEDCAVGFACVDGDDVPICAPGCRSDADCRSGERCKASGPAATPCAERPDHADPNTLGVCCTPGCTDRALQCRANQFCCGEPDSPYRDPAACPTEPGPVRAGECFDLPVDPFCQQCTPGRGGCMAAWPFGRNVDPDVDGGQPFDEQSFCFAVSPSEGLCSVGYRADGADPGAPRGWACGPFPLPCYRDADCGGLTCVGADRVRRVFGACRCAEAGIEGGPCPMTVPALAEPVRRPRCRPAPGVAGAGADDRFCIAGYLCRPPAVESGRYPPACGL